LFFLAEYANIILMSILIVILFLGGWLPIFNINILYYLPKELWIIIKTLFIIYLFILVRGTLPRYRYDQLMMLGWKIFLPISLSYLIYYIILYLIISFFI
jgi:NADH-quinone oxidoreductase subunit H